MSIVISNSPISSDIPTRIPGLQIWLDANDSNTLTYSVSSSVTQWRDKSSNAFIFSSITSNTPLFVTDSYRQGVFFNSARSNLMRTTTNVTFTSNVTTIFAIGNHTSSMLCSMMVAFGANQDLSLRFGNLNTLNANDIFFPNTINYNASTIGSYPYGPTGYFVNNGVVGSGFTGSASSNLQLSSEFNTNRYYHGYINEVIIYSNTLTSAQRLQVEGYLAWKWGVINRFPTNYTYANSNPNLSFPIPIYPYSAEFTTDNLSNPFSSRIATYNWQPNATSGLIVWFDSADSATLANSGQTTFSWASKGSLTLSATVSAGSNGPTVSNFNGFPGIYFNGVNTKLVSGAVTSFGASATTWLACSTYLSTPTALTPDAALVVGYNTVNSERALRYNSPTSATMYTINTGTLRQDTGVNSNGVRGFIDQASYYRGFVNGSASSSNGTAVTYNSGAGATLLFGQWNVGSLLGFIHEILIYNRELTITEYQKSEAYLAWKYGYQKQLPPNNPYYWFPPN